MNLSQVLNELGITGDIHFHKTPITDTNKRNTETVQNVAAKLKEAVGDKELSRVAYSYRYNSSPILMTITLNNAIDAPDDIILTNIAFKAIDLFGYERCMNLLWSYELNEEHHMVFDLS